MTGRPTLRMVLSITTLLCLPLAGCGNHPAQSDSEHASPAVVRTASAGVPVPAELSPAGGERLEIEHAETSSPSRIELTQARLLFDRLVSPTQPAENWDESLAQLLQEEGAAAVLAEKLSSGTPAERELAASTLALMGVEAASVEKTLVAALQDELPFVRANVAATLVQLPEHAQDAIPTLTQLLLADDPQLRQLAAVNLNAAGVVLTDHIEQFRQALQRDNSEDVLTPVVELLGRMGEPAKPALPELRKIARQQRGELGAKASSAIQLISRETESSAP